MVSPSIFREFAEAFWRTKPHSSVRSLGNRRNRVGSETIASGVVGKVTVLQFAHTSTQRTGPHRAVLTLVDGIDGVLRESVVFCVGPAADCVGCNKQSRQTSTLSPNPELMLLSGNRVHNIVGQRIVRNRAGLRPLEPVQAALQWCKPSASVLVNVNRAAAV